MPHFTPKTESSSLLNVLSPSLKRLTLHLSAPKSSRMIASETARQSVTAQDHAIEDVRFETCRVVVDGIRR